MNKELKQKIKDEIRDVRTRLENGCYTVVIHAVIMSIIFEHYKQLTKLMEQKKAKDEARSSTLDVWTQKKCC